MARRGRGTGTPQASVDAIRSRASNLSGALPGALGNPAGDRDAALSVRDRERRHAGFWAAAGEVDVHDGARRLAHAGERMAASGFPRVTQPYRPNIATP